MAHIILSITYGQSAFLSIQRTVVVVTVVGRADVVIPAVVIPAVVIAVDVAVIVDVAMGKLQFLQAPADVDRNVVVT